MEDLKRAMAHVSVKSHANGALNPRAHLRRPVTEDEVLNAPIVAYPLGLYDCLRRQRQRGLRHRRHARYRARLGKKEVVTVKALAGGPLQRGGDGLQRVGRDVLYDHRPLRPGGLPGGWHHRPRREISMMEVHDCFSITELVTMEDPAHLGAGEGLEGRSGRLL